jgi:hypothetical protein
MSLSLPSVALLFRRATTPSVYACVARRMRDAFGVHLVASSKMIEGEKIARGRRAESCPIRYG